MKKKISLGFSPCPNDTFIFDALVNSKIETSQFIFEPVIVDVEELNKMALKGVLNVTKLSVSAFSFASDNYSILDSGSALGFGCGPLLVSKNDFAFGGIDHLKIAIPGKYTTANLLLSIFAPNAINKTEFLFSKIEDAVISGKVDAGVIIHENRFTYHQKGLKKIADLGQMWEEETGMPIPLGCISVNNKLSDEVKQKINSLIKESIEFAFANPESSKNYIKKHCRQMDNDVIAKHISLYVNKYSINLDEEGKNAISFLLKKGNMAKLLPPVFNLFLNPAKKTIHS